MSQLGGLQEASRTHVVNVLPQATAVFQSSLPHCYPVLDNLADMSDMWQQLMVTGQMSPLHIVLPGCFWSCVVLMLDRLHSCNLSVSADTEQ